MSGSRRSCGTCEGFVVPFGPILVLLGRLLALFWLSWDTFGPHFGSLGASWDALLAQVGPRWPKMAKKTSIFLIIFRKLAQVGRPKSRKIDVKNDVFFRCFFNIDFHRFLMDFGLPKSMFLGSIFELKTKTSIL